MSNIIPPLLSNTPPPPPSPEDDDDDEFGDFTGANDFSYGCDNLSLPPSPETSPKKISLINGLDINSNTEKNEELQVELGKDFQDKRKSNTICFNSITNIKQKCVLNEHETISDLSGNTSDNLHVPNSIFEYPNFEENESNINGSICKKTDEDFSLTENSDNEEIELHKETTIHCNLETNETASKKEKPLDLSTNGSLTKCENLPSETNIVSDLKNDLDDNLNIETNEVKENEFKKSLNKQVDMDSLPLNVTMNSFENFTEEFAKVKMSATEVLLKETNVSTLVEEEQHKKTDLFGHNIINQVNVTVTENQTTNTENLYTQSEPTYNDNEFGEFAFADSNLKDTIEILVNHNEINHTSTDSKNVFVETDCQEIPKIITASTFEEQTIEAVDVDDDFDDFCDFASNTITEVPKEETIQIPSIENNDFGNFANFSDVVDEPVYLVLNEKQALEKAESILKDIFPVCNNFLEDFQYDNVENNDFVFNELKDITETNALTYQWSKSASQNMLLRALNIDARNILYGAPWNPSMPKFAANLGLTPLQPIKTEPIPSAVKSCPSNVQPPSSDIPSAQFDWNGSGLVNPLDYSQTMLLDLEQLVASLDIPSHSNNSPSSSNDLNDWDSWLQSEPKELSNTLQVIEKSVNSTLEPSVLQPQIVTSSVICQKDHSKNDLEQEVTSQNQSIDDFDDFTSYQVPSGSSETWPNIVPLRETYISSDVKELPLDIENWLQPTIVTPELPRKDIEIGEELPNIETPEFTRKNVVVEDNDFDDFQMVLPNATTQNISNVNPECLQSVQTKTEEPKVLNNLLTNANLHFSNLKRDEGKLKINSIKVTNQNKTILESDIIRKMGPATIINDEDDDFTEFHSSVPTPQLAEPKPLTPILEPLKPIPVYPTIAAPTSTQINWPDPGITDEEIKKIELVFNRPQELIAEETNVIVCKENKTVPTKLTKDNSLDEDEWSDFVSVQKPSPVHKFQSTEKDRTSSPDLTLSVLNLGNIQPTKQPIPVITPQGLIQTKLSSSNAVNLSPKFQLKNNQSSSQHKPIYQKPQLQPSIISNQFASQAYSFSNGNKNQNKTGLNLAVSQPQTAGNNLPQQDDDDWSDFISSPLPPTTANGYQHNWQNTPTYNQVMWTNPSPNIITNPGHLIQSGSDMKNKKVSNISVNNKKSTIPSISLPELEFIAPKSRTSSRKK